MTNRSLFLSFLRSSWDPSSDPWNLLGISGDRELGKFWNLCAVEVTDEVLENDTDGAGGVRGLEVRCLGSAFGGGRIGRRLLGSGRPAKLGAEGCSGAIPICILAGSGWRPLPPACGRVVAGWNLSSTGGMAGAGRPPAPGWKPSKLRSSKANWPEN